MGGFAKSWQAAPCLLVLLCHKHSVVSSSPGLTGKTPALSSLHFSTEQTWKDLSACLSRGVEGGTPVERAEPCPCCLGATAAVPGFASPCPQNVTRACPPPNSLNLKFTQIISLLPVFLGSLRGFICFSALFSEVVSQHPAAP